MDDFKSFVYQMVENPVSFLPAKCIVHFRPHEGWDGTKYGFDWMREGDTEAFGDEQPYVNIVGKQYNNADSIKIRVEGEEIPKIGELVKNTNVYNGTFKLDYSLYQQLEKEYNPMLILAKPIKPPLAVPTYYCSWLSIFPEKDDNPNTKATLRLYIEVIEKPDYLEFEENECFTVSPMKITDDLQVGSPRFWKNGATITIECKKAINVPAAINIFACKKDEVKGVIVKKLAGRLWVWENDDKKLKEAKILLVNVRTTHSKAGDYRDMGTKKIVGKYLPQALITPNVEVYKNGYKLDVSNDAEFRRRFVINEYILRTNDLDRTLYEKLTEDLEKNGEPADKYLGYCILFYVEGTPDVECAAATNSMARRAVIFKFPRHQPFEITVNHELFHCMQLDHTFSNLIRNPHSSVQSRNATYTYQVFQTENIMDYSSIYGKKIFATWKWQWEIANKSVKYLKK